LEPNLFKTVFEVFYHFTEVYVNRNPGSGLRSW